MGCGWVVGGGGGEGAGEEGGKTRAVPVLIGL